MAAAKAKLQKTSVQVDRTLYDEVMAVVEGSTGNQPNFPDFVHKAIKQRLEAYKQQKIDFSAESNLRKTGTEN